MLDPSGLFKQLILIGGLFGLITTWNAVFMGASRVLVTLVKMDKLTGSGGSSKLNLASRKGAIWFISFISFVGLLAGRGALAPIMTSMGLFFSTLYAVQCGSLIVALRQSPPHPDLPSISLTGPILGLISSLCIILLAFYAMRDNSIGLISAQVSILLVWVFLGSVFLNFKN